MPARLERSSGRGIGAAVDYDNGELDAVVTAWRAAPLHAGEQRRARRARPSRLPTSAMRLAPRLAEQLRPLRLIDADAIEDPPRFRSDNPAASRRAARTRLHRGPQGPVAERRLFEPRSRPRHDPLQAARMRRRSSTRWRSRSPRGSGTTHAARPRASSPSTWRAAARTPSPRCARSSRGRCGTRPC